MKKLVVILCIVLCTSCQRHELSTHFALSEFNIKRGMNNILNFLENNEKINFMDGFADELIDRKIYMGMGFHELNKLFNNELERDRYTKEEDISGGFYFKNDFLPYFEKDMGQILFVIDEKYGLWWYKIIIYENEEYFNAKFNECIIALNKKYGDESRNNFRSHYWTKNENNLPYGVSVVESFVNYVGGGERIDILYFSKSYFMQNQDKLRSVVNGILEVKAGIPDCCTRAAMRGI
jgi:hypothetical protein